MDGTVHIVALDQKPCVVHYLEQHNKFLVGTYELFPTLEEARLKLNSHLDDGQLRASLEKINYRAGKLILLRGNDVSLPSIEYDFDCHAGGGVFDAKVRYNEMDASYSIYVAHSNGTIGIYKLSFHCGNKICLKEHIVVPDSKMLTCIDMFREKAANRSHLSSTAYRMPNDTLALHCSSSGYANTNSHSLSQHLAESSSSLSSSSTVSPSPNSPLQSSLRLVVGDAEGFVTIINQVEPVRVNVAQGDSVWQVESLKLASGKDVVFVGAENSTWYVYGFSNDQDRELILLYKNSFKDFAAGITSISILDVVCQLEYDLVEIMLGSYDETLQTYHVKINHDGISKPDVCHKNTISISNGGIWRVKQANKSSACKKTRKLCIAAMYGGSYILSLDGEQHQSGGVLTKLIDTEILKLNNRPLHYDIDVSTCSRTYCVVDFNNSMCLFKTID